MRITLMAVPVLLFVASACDGGASPTVDTSFVLPDGGIEPTLPVGSDPQTTAAPNPAAGGGAGDGGATGSPAPTGAGTAP